MAKKGNYFKYKTCNVINKIGNSIIINFDGKGISFTVNNDFHANEVKVKYTGTIGKSDFSCELV